MEQVASVGYGFWVPLREEFPDTHEQRDWVHRTANVCAQFLYPDVGAGITRTLQIGTVAPAAMLLPLPHKEPIVDMDPNNPVVKMCVQGMQAESEGRHDDARRLFEQAWAERSDDYEACIAAHYLARHQERPQDVLRWNQTALDHAKLVDDERVHGFYPSLYLNLGRAYEQTGHRDKAARYYQLGAERVQELPEGPYGDMVRSAIARGQQRISEVDQ